MRKKIGTKIIGGYVLFVVLVLSFLGASYRLMTTTVGHTQDMYDRTEVLRLEMETENILLGQVSAMTDYLLLGHEEYLTDLSEHQRQFSRRLETLQPLIGGQHTEEGRTLELLKNKYNIFIAQFEKTLALYQAGNHAEAIKIEVEEVDPAAHEAERLLESLIKTKKIELARSVENVRALNRYAGVFPFLSTTIENAEIIHSARLALQNQLEAEAISRKQEIVKSDLFLFDNSKYIARFDELEKEYQKVLDRKIGFAAGEKETALVNAIKLNHQLLVDGFTKAARLYQAGDKLAALNVERDEMDPFEESSEKLPVEFYQLKKGDLSRSLANVRLMDATALSIIKNFGIYVLILLVIGLIAGTLIAVRISGPISQLVEATQRLTTGDFAARAKVKSRDEVGDLAASFNRMAENLQKTMVLKDSLKAVAEKRTTELAHANEALQSDLVERTRIEIELKTNEMQLTDAQHIAHLGSWEWDVLANTVTWSDELYRIFGLPPRELGATYEAFLATVHPDDRPLVKSAIEEGLKQGVFPEFEHRVVHPDGNIVGIQASGKVIVDATGRVIKMLGTALDITERKKAETALLEADRRAVTEYERLLNRLASLAQSFGSARDLTTIYRALVEFTIASAPCTGIVIAIYHPARQVREAVYVWAEGREESLSELAAMPVGDGPIGQAIRTGEVLVYEDLEREVNGPTLRIGNHNDTLTRPAIIAPMAIMGRVIGVLEIQNHDGEPYKVEHVTALRMAANLAAGAIENVRLLEQERRKEERLQQAQKMESIGTLAGGIAHDFNNILAAILGYSELAANDIPSDHVAQSHLIQVLQAANRARESVQQILTFSRRQEADRKTVNLGPVLVEALSLLRTSLPATIQVVTQIHPDVPPILGDAGRIHQVMMNLATNAMQAMSERGGVLEVKLVSLEMDADAIQAHPDLCEGRYLHLTVSDSGCGMNPQTLERIFEPFFTTKGPGEGTGLGLATVYGIVKEHNGAISVYSQPGEGTTFHIYFPIHLGKAPEAVLPALAIPQGSGQHVMFVDDEASLAMLGKQGLERLGYQVTTHTSSMEALKAFRACPTAFDLVITDYTMPHLNGADLTIDMLKVRPEMPVIMLTGYSSTMSAEKTASIGIRELLMKPATAQTIGQAVNRLLAQMKEK